MYNQNKSYELNQKKEEKVNVISLESVYDEVRKLKALLENMIMPNRDRIFNNKTLSDYLGICTRTLQNWRDANLISFTQIGDVIIYTEDDVRVFMKKHRRAALK